jgi:hypothetical protein
MSEGYDRKKFVAEARAAEDVRLEKLNEFNQKQEAWIHDHGPIPFQCPRLVFDGK